MSTIDERIVELKQARGVPEADQAVNDWERCIAQSFLGGVVDVDYATPEEVTTARERHCDGSDNEIEIDEPARASRGDEGMWVQAWVWIPTKESDDDAG